MTDELLQEACEAACRDEIAPLLAELDLDDDVTEAIAEIVGQAMVIGVRLAAIEINARLVTMGHNFTIDIDAIDEVGDSQS